MWFPQVSRFLSVSALQRCRKCVPICQGDSLNGDETLLEWFRCMFSCVCTQQCMCVTFSLSFLLVFFIWWVSVSCQISLYLSVGLLPIWNMVLVVSNSLILNVLFYCLYKKLRLQKKLPSTPIIMISIPQQLLSFRSIKNKKHADYLHYFCCWIALKIHSQVLLKKLWFSAFRSVISSVANFPIYPHSCFEALDWKPH